MPPPNVPGYPGGKLPPPRPERRHPAAEPSNPPSGDTTLQSPSPEAEVTPVSGRGSVPPPAPRREREPTRPGIGERQPEDAPARRPAVRASVVDRYEAELERKPARNVPSIEPPRSITPSSGQPAVPYSRAEPAKPLERVRVVVEPSWWHTARGMAVVVPIIVTALGTITVGVVLPVIKAIREPYEGAKAADIEKARKAGEQCESAVSSERTNTLARETDIGKRITAVDQRVDEIARRVPAVKPDPNRPPK